jgi:hypothetical protein
MGEEKKDNKLDDGDAIKWFNFCSSELIPFLFSSFIRTGFPTSPSLSLAISVSKEAIISIKRKNWVRML